MKKQRGLTLTALLCWGIGLALLAVLGMKVAPEYLTYYKILQASKAVASGSSGKTVPEIRAAFDKRMDVDYIKDFTGKDIDISKEGNAVVLSFSYEKRIPLFYNISLLIDFEGSSAGRE